MARTLKWSAIAAAVSLCALTACGMRNRCQPSEAPPRVIASEDDETPAPHTTIPEVMRSKLAHSQAVLEGITLQDFAQIEINARDLRRISLSGEWLVLETPSYIAFSEEFRRITDELIAQARRHDLRAVTQSYANLTNSCVSCHTYLRTERQFKDMPGRVSMSSP